MKTTTSRRKFLQHTAGVGSGLTLGFFLPMARAAAASAPSTAAAATTSDVLEINAWVIVRPDNTVVIRYARSEMGQGSSTAAPMLVAEELECDWKQVRMEYVSANAHFRRNRVWGNLMTAGSSTIRLPQETLRKAGASAREMLIAAAAARWNVSASECVAALGVITHTPTRRKLNYGQIAEAAGGLTPPTDVKLKDPKDWKLAGKSLARLDIPATVMGRQQFGIDVQLPGMVYATVVQCPVFGGSLKSVDAAKLQGRRGFIKVVPIENGVAIVADSWWRAREMARDLVIEWDDGGNGQVTSASIALQLRAGLDQAEVPVMRRDGDVEAAFRAAGRTIEAEYYTPYLAHATLEPQVCTALLKDGRLDLWPSSQDAAGDLEQAALTAGLPHSQVEVHRVQAGGGFGRRAVSIDYVRQSVAIAKAMAGTPVKLLWTREEDTQHDYYRPVALYRMRASLDVAGRPSGWTTRVAMPSIYATLMKLPLEGGIDRAAAEGFRNFIYAIPNLRMEYARCEPHVHIGFWRGVGHSQNPFARECFLDELAHTAGQDPYEFRRSLLAPGGKSLGVLDAAARAAGWGKPLPAGVFRGIALTEPYNSFAAAVVEISVSDSGTLTVHRIVSAIDCGYVVNPDTAIAQMEGSAIWGLTAALHGEITITDGRVEQSNFHDYPLLRLAEAPKVEVVLAPTGGFWGGVGEPGTAPIAPALCNAIFAATGQRIRSLPLKNHDLKRT